MTSGGTRDGERAACSWRRARTSSITAPRTFRNLAEIENPAENLVGVASAGSEGAITAAQLAVRPVNRAAEVLETVPGMIISQHSGEGKANQYYLRGFNLDHGFDFAQTIAGIPVNMPTHAHAQGYADSNFLIPELVSGVQFRKGPYYAENGDFSSAGSANINYFNVLERPIVTLTGGSFDYGRFLGAVSPRVGTGQPAGRVRVGAGQRPVGQPEQQGQVQRRRPLQPGRRAQRAVADVPRIQEPLALDRPDSAARRRQPARSAASGSSRRPTAARPIATAGVFDWQRSGTNDSTRVTGYVQRYGVQLFHNFTYFLNDPVNGDQFEQFEERWTTRRQADAPPACCASAESRPRTRSAWTSATIRSADRSGCTTRGQTERLATIRADDVDQLSVGHVRRDGNRVEPHGPDDVRAARRRLSLERRRPTTRSTPATRRSAIVEPEGVGGVRPVGRHRALRQLGTRLPLELRPGHRPAGRSGHGRTGRRRRRRSRAPTALSSASAPWPFAGLQTTATLWYLGFDSELIYVGDSGSTEAGPASRRTGVEITNYIYPNRWTTLDLDLSFSRARFLDVPPGEDFVPGALNRVISGGHRGQPAGRRAARARSAACGSGTSARGRSSRTTASQSKSTSIVNGEIGYKFSERMRLIARRLQPLRRRGVRHRLLLRVAPAGRAGSRSRTSTSTPRFRARRGVALRVSF